VSRTHYYYYYFRGGGEGIADDGGDAILWVRFCSTVPGGHAEYSAADDAATAAVGSFGIPAGKRARPGHSITAMGFSFSFQSERCTGTPTRYHHAITTDDYTAAAATSPAAVFLSRALCSFYLSPKRRPIVKGPAPSPHTHRARSIIISTLPLTNGYSV